MLYKMSKKFLCCLKRAPGNIEKTKFGQNIDADHQFEHQKYLETFDEARQFSTSNVAST